MTTNPNDDAIKIAKKILDDNGGSEIAGISTTVLEISKDLTYPIANFKELITKIGNRRLDIAGFSVSTEIIKDLEGLVPQNYFPVRSRQDLIEKFSRIALHKIKKLQNARKNTGPFRNSKYVESSPPDRLPQEFRNLSLKTPKPLNGIHENTGVLRRMDD